MSLGEQLNAWHEEWQASEELQFQFLFWTDYGYRRLREAWDASPALQKQHAHDYRAFKTAAKKGASAAQVAVREKVRSDAAKQEAKAAAAKNPVGRFIREILKKQ